MYDLFKNIFEWFGVVFIEIIIFELKGGVFYVKLMGKKVDGILLEVDVRLFDVIVMVVCFGCLIYIIENIM